MKQVNEIVALNNVLEHKKSLLESTMFHDQRECQLLQQQLQDMREQYTALTSWKSSSIQTIADLEKQVIAMMNLIISSDTSRIPLYRSLSHSLEHPPNTRYSHHTLYLHGTQLVFS